MAKQERTTFKIDDFCVGPSREPLTGTFAQRLDGNLKRFATDLFIVR